MSRGLGTLQRRVLETLATYHRLGPALQWKWRTGSRYSFSQYADDNSIRLYERGWYVHVWMLRRDLGCTSAELSRALRALEQRELVFCYDGSLEYRERRYRRVDIHRVVLTLYRKLA